MDDQEENGELVEVLDTDAVLVDVREYRGLIVGNDVID